MRKTVISKIAAVGAVAAGAVGALALPAGADVGAFSPPIGGVQIGSPAALGTRGAAVTVPVTVLCTSGSTGSVSLEVVENTGGKLARGFGGSDTIVCDGTFQSTSVNVVSITVPFKRGTAFATASLSVCDFNGCLNDTDQREIRIGR
jgi:hypothetical protein